MQRYLLIESRDSFGRERGGFCVELARALVARGDTTTVLLVQNGALAARRGAQAPPLDDLTAAGVPVFVDEFALRERGMRRAGGSTAFSRSARHRDRPAARWLASDLALTEESTPMTTERPWLAFALMDAPFESARTTTALRLLDAARRGCDLKVFAYEGAVLLPFARQQAHPNAVHGRSAEEENHPLPRTLWPR